MSASTWSTLLEFDVGKAGLLTSSVRVSVGPEPKLYRLETELFPHNISTEVDEDTIETFLWTPPLRYHDVFGADRTLDDRGSEVLVFRRLVSRSEDPRYEFSFSHEYLVASELLSDEAEKLRDTIEKRGGYWCMAAGGTKDRLVIVLPCGNSYDPTPEVEALRRRA